MHLTPSSPTGYLGRPLAAPDLRYLDHLRREFPESPLAACATWDEVRDRVEEADIWSDKSDEILCPLLTAYRRAPGENPRNALLFVFWPYLERLARRLRSLDGDPDRVDSQVCWSFLQALHGLAPDQRRIRLGQKLLNDTQHHVRLHFARERARAAGCRPLRAEGENEDDSDERGGVICPGAEDGAFAAFENLQNRDWACARLKDLARRGRISRTNCLILIGCHLYGHSLEEMAGRLGLSYQTAKRGRLRAVTYLRRFPKYLSPYRRQPDLRDIGPAHRKERTNDGTL